MTFEEEWDEDAAAYHEAGHAVAAVLCVVGWEEAALRGPGSLSFDQEGTGGWVGLVEGHVDDTSPANKAFIFWAGSWAHARYLDPDDPWRALTYVQQEQAGSDMEVVQAYWNDPEQAPHETEEEWASALDRAWGSVERLADRLVTQGTVTPRDAW